MFGYWKIVFQIIGSFFYVCYWLIISHVVSVGHSKSCFPVECMIFIRDVHKFESFQILSMK